MGFFADLALGARPDYRQLPGMQGYINAVPGDPGQSMSSRYAKHDLKMGAQGQIENMYSLRPVLSAINANKAASYTTGRRQMSKDLAFGADPMLHAALDSELTGRLDENAGTQFANAAGGAYQTASDTLESRNRFRNDMEYRSAMDKASLYKSSMYDASRKGGLLQDMLKAGMGAASGGLFAATGPRSTSPGFGTAPGLGGVPDPYANPYEGGGN